MKRIVVLFLISLLLPIASTSQTISKDSVLILNSEQIKLTNLIFAEHEKLTEENGFLRKKIEILNEYNKNYEHMDSIQQNVIKTQNANIEKLNKSIRYKNMLITSIGTGLLLSLIVLFIK